MHDNWECDDVTVNQVEIIQVLEQIIIKTNCSKLQTYKQNIIEATWKYPPVTESNSPSMAHLTQITAASSSGLNKRLIMGTVSSNAGSKIDSNQRLATLPSKTVHVIQRASGEAEANNFEPLIKETVYVYNI